jgi:hypothetical protein
LLVDSGSLLSNHCGERIDHLVEAVGKMFLRFPPKPTDLRCESSHCATLLYVIAMLVGQIELDPTS